MKDTTPPILPHSTVGQKVADFIARNVGSWKFIIGQSIILLAWITWNSIQSFRAYHFDAYPYILLNLMLSFQAAYTGPILLIAANRQAYRDRVLSETNYRTVKTLVELTNHLIKQGENEVIYNKKLYELLKQIKEDKDAERTKKDSS